MNVLLVLVFLLVTCVDCTGGGNIIIYEVKYASVVEVLTLY